MSGGILVDARFPSGLKHTFSAAKEGYLTTGETDNGPTVDLMVRSGVDRSSIVGRPLGMALEWHGSPRPRPLLTFNGKRDYRYLITYPTLSLPPIVVEE